MEKEKKMDKNLVLVILRVLYYNVIRAAVEEYVKRTDNKFDDALVELLDVLVGIETKE